MQELQEKRVVGIRERQREIEREKKREIFQGLQEKGVDRERQREIERLKEKEVRTVRQITFKIETSYFLRARTLPTVRYYSPVMKHWFISLIIIHCFSSGELYIFLSMKLPILSLIIKRWRFPNQKR